MNTPDIFLETYNYILMKIICLKSICILFISIFSISNIFASEVFFLNKNVDEAVQLATKLNKPFFAFFCGTWCPTCKVMQDHTFTDDRVAKFASDNYLAFKLNIDEPGGKAWKERYGVYLVPTVIFFDKYGNQKDVHATTLGADAFLNIMQRNADVNPSTFVSAYHQPATSTTYTSSSSASIPAASSFHQPATTSNPPPTNTVAAVAQPNILSTVATKAKETQLNTTPRLSHLSQTKEKESKTAEEEVYAAVNPNDRAGLRNEVMGKVETKKNEVSNSNEVLNNSSSLPTQVTPTFNTVPTTQTNVDPSLVTEGRSWSRPSKKSKEQSMVQNNPQIENEAAVVTPSGVTTSVESTERKVIILNPTTKKTEPINIHIKAERPSTISTPPPAQTYYESPPPAKQYEDVIPKPSSAYLQLGYFKEQAYADRLIRKIYAENLGYTIEQKATKLNGVWVQKIIMTGFGSKEEAEKIKGTLKSAGFKSYLFE